MWINHSAGCLSPITLLSPVLDRPLARSLPNNFKSDTPPIYIMRKRHVRIMRAAARTAEYYAYTYNARWPQYMIYDDVTILFFRVHTCINNRNNITIYELVVMASEVYTNRKQEWRRSFRNGGPGPV